jgi:hypothetical protein
VRQQRGRADSAFNTTGGPWSAQDDNTYGTDYVGVYPDTVAYYQYYGLNLPCKFSLSGPMGQQMQISNGTGSGQPYGAVNSGGPNSIVITISTTGTSVTRGDNGGGNPPAQATAPTQPYAYK